MMQQCSRVKAADRSRPPLARLAKAVCSRAQPPHVTALRNGIPLHSDLEQHHYPLNRRRAESRLPWCTNSESCFQLLLASYTTIDSFWGKQVLFPPRSMLGYIAIKNMAWVSMPKYPILHPFPFRRRFHNKCRSFCHHVI